MDYNDKFVKSQAYRLNRETDEHVEVGKRYLVDMLDYAASFTEVDSWMDWRSKKYHASSLDMQAKLKNISFDFSKKHAVYAC